MAIIESDKMTLQFDPVKLHQYLTATLDIKLESPSLTKLNIVLPYNARRTKNGAVVIQAKSTDNADFLDIPSDQLARIVKGIVWRDQHFAGETLSDIATRNHHGENYVNRCIQESLTFLSH